jgi:iron complex transport system substrate-binding protein
MHCTQAFLLLGVLFAGLGCQKRQAQTSHAPNAFAPPPSAAQAALRYAQCFALAPNGSSLTVNNCSGKAENLARYAFTDTAHGAVRIPFNPKRIAVLSTTHLPYLEALGLLDRVVAVDQAKRIHNAYIIQGVQEGRIVEVGDGQGLNYERLLAAKPDVVIRSGSGSAAQDANPKLDELGIRHIVNVEWRETTPLGRAEWIKFFGALFGKLPKADSVFTQIEKRYAKAKAIAQGVQQKPTVFTGRSWRGTWYVPGGQSFAAHFIADAGGQYVWADQTGSGSAPLKLEAVFARAAGADVWLNMDEFTTEAAMLQEDPRYAKFKAFAQHQLYNHNKRLNPSGGDDYWERGMLEPDVILTDLVKIFHPQLVPQHTLQYYRQLTAN